jgi:FKBP-type peptidyl-prolyl cis-trans isomerase
MVKFGLMAGVVVLAGMSAMAQTSSGTAAQNPASPASKSAGAPAAKPATPSPFASQKDRVSYALGYNVGRNLHHDGVAIDTKIMMQALNDAMADKPSLMSDDDIKGTMIALQGEVRKRQEEKRNADMATNKKAGDEFLAANKSKPGVKVLPDGLQYKVIKEGSGPKPEAADQVVVKYRGTLIDGKEFDSSEKHGGTSTFTANRVIKGWTEALEMMPVGSKWEIYVPSDLAYGDRGSGPMIGPNSTLVFEIELVSITPKSEVKTPATPADGAKPVMPSTPAPAAKQ